MKLLVPYTSACPGLDVRLSQLAKFMGLECAPIPLASLATGFAKALELATTNLDSCLVVNPETFRQWTGGELPPDLIRCMTTRFKGLMIHGLSPDPFASSLVRALSGGEVESIEALDQTGAGYDIAPNSRAISGAFCGLSFGHANAGNDCLLKPGNSGTLLETVISIAGRPFMAVMRREDKQFIFLASRDTAELNEEISEFPLHTYFSKCVPHAMALRALFGEECWQSSGRYGALIIDDPLIRPQHGFLDFKKALVLMEEHNFSTVVGFIPHNYRRSLAPTAQIFRDHPKRLSICVHGNDHTAGEYASQDVAWLNTITKIAESRMRQHQKMTGVSCSNVMVFPHENFSVQALKVLKARNFHAVVNSSASPFQRKVDLTLAEMAQPAVLRYGGMALFLRKYIDRLTPEDLAFGLFFGHPAFISEHHTVFQCTEKLLQVVAMVNRMAPDTQWTDLETAVVNTSLRRKMADGGYAVRAYSATTRIVNESDSARKYTVEWNYPQGAPGIESLSRDGEGHPSFEVRDSTIRLQTEIPAGRSEELSVRYRNSYQTYNRLGLTWNVKAFLRRRISEARDGYATKSPAVMNLFKTLKEKGLEKFL